MAIKKTGLFSVSLICLLFVFCSFGPLAAGADQNVSYQKISWINQKFHDFANALFRYDTRIKDAQSQLNHLQECLSMSFSERKNIYSCAGLSNTQLQEKIDLLEIKIAELTANKNKIVTMQDALKKYWYALIPIIAAGGYAAYRYLQPTEIEELPMQLPKAEVSTGGANKEQLTNGGEGRIVTINPKQRQLMKVLEGCEASLEDINEQLKNKYNWRNIILEKVLKMPHDIELNKELDRVSAEIEELREIRSDIKKRWYDVYTDLVQ